MIVDILATPKLMDLAKTALEIQDACNPVPVCSFLQKCISYWCGGNFEAKDEGQHNAGSDIAMQNPVTRVVLDKMRSLASVEDSSSDTLLAFSACAILAKGIDVKWNVEFS